MDKIVEIRNLSKHYRNVMGQRHFKALDKLSLEVERGEIFGLLGPNGSGKTTLLKLLLGLIAPTSGKTTVLGKSPRDINSKRRIGYLAEHPYFYEFLNSVELLKFYGSLLDVDPRIQKKKIPFLIEKVGLRGFEKMNIRNFSKGMLQRIGLAISLINDPELLFLDEPTLGLDPIGTLDIQNLLREIRAQGKTIFLSSHLLAHVQDLCDRIAIIYQGRILKVGRLEELLTVKDEMMVIVKGMDDGVRLRENLEQRGSEVLSISERKDSLEDLFIKIINKEKKN